MNSVLLITDDGRGIAQALANESRRLGRRAVLIQMGDRMGVVGQDRYAADITNPAAVAGLLDVIRQREGSLAGLIHLLPLQAGLPFEAMDFSEWRQRLRLEVKSLFYLAKAMASDLKQTAGRPGGGWLLAATAMGGRFASDTDGPLSFFPGQGGIAGLIKTATVEWPDVYCKVVDVDAEEPAATLASLLLREMGNARGQVEVGYKGSRRSVLRSQPAPLAQDCPIHLEIDSRWVVLITGGARGITAEVACELASRYRPTLILAGRAPVPVDDEPSETAGLSTPQELKGALLKGMRRAGQAVTPRVVEAATIRLLQDREMRRSLAAMQQAGATVRYCQADVRDPLSFGAVIDGIYREHGRLDGVIHGAGIIEDKLLADKDPESFDRTFDTKVDSAFILSRRLRPDTLKFLVFFGSVAGRFGNRGQADYAAANEVLNKLAVYLDRRWPGRMVSINWGPWEKTGMVSAEVQKQLAERGMRLIPPSIGRRMFADEIQYGRKGQAEVVIGSGPWNRLAELAGQARGDYW